MNKYLDALYKSALRPSRNIVGLMSGTSMDGLDLAYCTITGHGVHTKVEVSAFETIPYSEDTKDKIGQVFARENIHFPYLAMLNEWIGNTHGRMINEFLKKHKIPKSKVDAVASHGQTVMHAPRHQHGKADFPNATLQIGDGDHIAVTTGIITISDFRQKHLAAGGEGAPLAVYGDYLIFSKSGEDRIMLNIGGIGNYTYLPGDGDASKVFVTDTGPGNTLMDAYMKKMFGLPYDKDAQVAIRGVVHQQLLDALSDHYFYNLNFPKTTGPEVFNLQYVSDAMNKENLKDISPEDTMATLNMLSAKTITAAIKHTIGQDTFHIYMSGGGAHNPLLVNTMESLLPTCLFAMSDDLGVLGDAKEAVLFAVLANETIAGHPVNFGNRQGIPSVCMGKISFPK